MYNSYSVVTHSSYHVRVPNANKRESERAERIEKPRLGTKGHNTFIRTDNARNILNFHSASLLSILPIIMSKQIPLSSK
ncbi:hypothetical protein ANTQUA_LOCUS3803 [Anthophora quadrimaculata]